jgi:hypothetical protein
MNFFFQVEFSDEEMDETTPALQSSRQLSGSEKNEKSLEETNIDTTSNKNTDIPSNIDSMSNTNIDTTSNTNIDLTSNTNIDSTSNTNIDSMSNKNVDATLSVNIDTTSNTNIDETSSNSNIVEPSHKLFYIDSAVFSSSSNKMCYSNSNLQLEEEKTTNDESSAVLQLENIKLESSSNLVNDVETSPKEVSRISVVRKRLKVAFEQFSVDNYDLPPDPNFRQRLKHSFLLPPHGPVGQFSTLVLIILTLWITW